MYALPVEKTRAQLWGNGFIHSLNVPHEVVYISQNLITNYKQNVYKFTTVACLRRVIRLCYKTVDWVRLVLVAFVTVAVSVIVVTIVAVTMGMAS